MVRDLSKLPARTCYVCCERPIATGLRCAPCARKRLTVSIAGKAALRLVEDTRPGVFSRREATCARLSACEEAWIRVYIGANVQARCPEACDGFVRKVER